MAGNGTVVLRWVCFRKMAVTSVWVFNILSIDNFTYCCGQAQFQTTSHALNEYISHYCA